MAYQITGFIGGQPLDTTSTTQNHPLGTRVCGIDPANPDFGMGEFVYLKGVASTALGSVVLIKDDLTTSLATARDKGGIGVAMSANVANQYGWYQIKGVSTMKVLASFAANNPVYLTATPGSVDDAVVAGDLIIGARSKSAIDTPSAGLAYVTLAVDAAAADFDNA